MKQSKTCPKCGSAEIYTNDSLISRGERSIISVTGWVSLSVAVYVCIDCGYTEEYITAEDLNNPKKIDNVKAEWRKIE